MFDKKLNKHLIAMLLTALLCAAGTLAAAQSRYADDMMRVGSQSYSVRLLQEDLAELGFYKGNITGHYGNLTKEAVRKFQRKNKLTADGIAGPRTLSKLESLMGGSSWSGSDSWSSGSSGSCGSSGSTSTGSSTTLKLNSSGEAVRALQENLRKLDYYHGTITGHYGNLTKEAVRVFQKENGLTADGIAGPRTLAKIEEKLGKESAKGDSGSAGSDGTQQSGDKKDEEKKDDGQLDTSVTLRYGNRSENVRRLQEALELLGYFKGNVTGYYGLNTTNAVKEYQDDKNLTVDGIAGKATLRAVNADLAKRSASQSQTVASMVSIAIDGAID